MPLPPDLCQLVQRTAPSGMLAFDDLGTIVYANEHVHEWMKAPPGSLIGTRFDKVLAPASRIFQSTHLFPLFRLHRRADEVHLILRDSEGSDIPVLLSGVREGEGADALNHCAMMIVSQRKEFESKLLEARQAAEAAASAKDQFLAVVSHELRNPLSAITGWVRLMQSGKLDETMTKRALDTIARNAKAQSVLIEDLLDVSRIISGKLRLSPRAIELASVIEAALDTGRPAALAKGIELITALDRDAGLVHADPERIQQVVWNLVSNAVKFTPKAGRIQVTLSRVESRVWIEVSDNGEGIPESQLPYLFERFWQAPGQRRERQGLGLGLSICKSLVELHGGSLYANSPGPGLGTTFTVEIPLALAVSASSISSIARREQGDAAVDTLEGLTVLVVDDDVDARALMKMLLEAAGASVRAASSANDALEALQEKVPDVLLSDVGMPGKDGFELIRLIRSGKVPAAKQVPAVAVTGLARPSDRVNLLRAGFQAHLSKPLEPSEAVALVKALAHRD